MKNIITKLGLIFISLVISFPFWSMTNPSPVQAASLSDLIGVVSPVPSATSSDRTQLIDKMTEGGFGWVRYEIHYTNAINFEPYDQTQTLLEAKGIKSLGLLNYPGSDISHDQWKTFVSAFAGHLGSRVGAWEIMNEADNYLSASDYTVYLKEAHDIIKANNPNATIVSSGITDRIEAVNFWNGIADAGGWGSFDRLGVHIYHNTYPEKVNFGTGDYAAQIDRAVGTINTHGGNKKIWITETGYNSDLIGEGDQANWLARALAQAASNEVVERIFVYGFRGTGYGILHDTFESKPAFNEIKQLIGYINGNGVGSRQFVVDREGLASLESTDGWSTQGSSNTNVNLSSVPGKHYQAVKIEYNFTADKAYAQMEQDIPISGTPKGLGVWINGDDTSNVWKLRFKDSKGETFQADLGNLPSGWAFRQFVFGKDEALTSWGGDYKIDFPIAFNSFIVDRQGSSNRNAAGYVDELVALNGGPDLYAYKFNSTLVYWSTEGWAGANACHDKRYFYTDPNYGTNVDCGDMSIVTANNANPKAKITAAKCYYVTKKTILGRKYKVKVCPKPITKTVKK